MKITLGSSQLGMKYGIANNFGKPTLTIVKEILDLASSLGITFIDTAQGYGDSEKNIGAFGSNRFKVITKITISDIYNNQNDLEKKVEKSLERLKLKSLYAVLIHDTSYLIKNERLQVLKNLEKLKEIGLINKIGLSIYRPEELDYLISNFDIDIVQCPFNIFDRRLLENDYIKKLKANSIEIHVRSVFLQGLLLMDDSLLPKYFLQWKPLLDYWRYWLKSKSLSPLEGCLKYVGSFPEIDQIIVGVEKPRQLYDIIKIHSNLEKLKFPDFSCVDENFIDPRNWK